MPQITATYPQNAKTVNVVGANAGLQVKTGAGTVLGVLNGTAGSSSTLLVYDGTSTSGTLIATFGTTAFFSADSLNWRFTTGLFLVTTGTNTNVTVAYA